MYSNFNLVGGAIWREKQKLTRKQIGRHSQETLNWRQQESITTCLKSLTSFGNSQTGQGVQKSLLFPEGRSNKNRVKEKRPISHTLSFVSRSISLAMVAIALLLDGADTPVSGDIIIDANKFTFEKSVIPERGNDFHLEIQGNFVGDPSSDVFPNRVVTNNPGPPPTATADFSGNDLMDGMSHNVKFKATGNNANPVGRFTRDRALIGGQVKSKALNGTEVTFIRAVRGFNASLNLINDFGSLLTGSVEVFVNTGLEHFTLDRFDILRDARPVFSTSNFLLDQGEGFLDLQAHLESRDEYLLIRGSVDSGDGFGDSPFALSISPLSIVQEFLTLDPIESTFETTATTGCPAGFEKFRFDARLTSKSDSPPLSNLVIQVRTLTNGNLLENADGETQGEGAILSIPEEDGFSDGVLNAGQVVNNVPFRICLKDRGPFIFFVDVLGIVE